MTKADFLAQLKHVLSTNYFVRNHLFPVIQAVVWLGLAVGLSLGYLLGWLTWG